METEIKLGRRKMKWKPRSAMKKQSIDQTSPIQAGGENENVTENGLIKSNRARKYKYRFFCEQSEEKGKSKVEVNRT